MSANVESFVGRNCTEQILLRLGALGKSQQKSEPGSQWNQNKGPDFRVMETITVDKNSGTYGLFYICIILLAYLLAVLYITARYFYTRSGHKTYFPPYCLPVPQHPTVERTVSATATRLETKAEIVAETHPPPPPPPSLPLLPQPVTITLGKTTDFGGLLETEL